MAKPRNRHTYQATPATQSDLEFLQKELGLSSLSDVVRESVEMTALLVSQLTGDRKLFVGPNSLALCEIVIPRLEAARARRQRAADKDNGKKEG